MSMSKSSKSEQRMLREIAYHFLTQHTCALCGEALIDPTIVSQLKLGGAYMPPIKERFTIHHADDNHSNNSPANRALTHQFCHKSHEMKKRYQVGYAPSAANVAERAARKSATVR